MDETTSYPFSTTEEAFDLQQSLEFPPLGANTTNVKDLKDIKMNAYLMWLMISLIITLAWVVYINFYNARIFGMIVTKIINRWYITGAHFRLGSLSITPIAGKIMFRDFVFVCFDYSIRIQDGYFIFRWWRSYVPKDVSEDLSHSDTRLSIQLNGFEAHIYNRSELYDKLEKTFGLSPSIFIPTDLSAEEKAKMKENEMNLENKRQNAFEKHKNSEAMNATTWRDLIPVIKIDICSGRFVFGNRLTPTTLSISMDEAHCTYSTKPAACQLDKFMHFVKAKVENSKVMFAPSPKYTGLADEPPRYMGEGFVVMMSNFMDLYFYMDEPGVVPDEPVHLTLANGDIIEPPPPQWGIEVKCGKGTDFSYGPWADRQRDHLFKFFFPSDWEEMQVDENPKAGQLRQYQTFEVTLCTFKEATIDILFSKDKETNAMHVTIGPGSSVEVSLPWVTHADGYQTKISGQLLHVEATTSLQYRSLAEFESLEYKVIVHYPRRWNDSQDWTINLTGCKATAYIVYKHKLFFQDLIEDWASKSRPDILSFVPYTCKFSVLLKEFELLTLSNEYNWIDCSSTNQENNHLAFCGDLLDLSFVLPFDDFLPQTVELKFWIHGEGLDLSMYIPEVSSTRSIVLAIDDNAKIMTRGGEIKNRPELYSKKWRKICQRSSGWVDCWSVNIIALSITYVYHPCPPLGPDPQADITTPEKEEILLSPMRMPSKKRLSPNVNWQHNESYKFDPSSLPADKVTVDLEIGSSVMLAYGTVLRNFINLKENIFGEDQLFTDMEQSNVKMKDPGNSNPKEHLPNKEKDSVFKSVSEQSSPEEKSKSFDPRLFRPLEVIVSVMIHDIQAHLMKNCNENDPPCPVILIERLGFEMNKRYTETELQVLVSPSYLITSDTLVRPNRDKHINQGHLLLSAVQVRGHAMFSNEGCALDEDTLEYAWLLEIQLGKLSGKLTLPQLFNICVGLETFILLTMDPENCLKSPKMIRNCHHGVPTNQCPQTNEENKYKCPSCEDIKYTMTRVSIDAIDIYLVESGTALHTWISPIRLSTCNLHGQRVKSGISGLLPSVLLRLFMVNNGGSGNLTNSHSNTNTTGSNRSGRARKESESRENTIPKPKRSSNSFSQRRDSREEPLKKKRDSFSDMNKRNSVGDLFENWLEVGCTSLGPILLEGASALPIPDHKLHIVQHTFLRLHDSKFKRLWFLWGVGTNGISTEITRCGCIGGCVFFGSNRNGLKFFKPSAQDIQENFNIARYHIFNNKKEYGFGESILHSDKLVFHTPPYSLHTVALYDNNEFMGKGRPYKPPTVELRNTGSLKLSETKKPDVNGRISRESMGSPNTLERRSKRYARQTSAEVPYARLIDSPSKRPVLQEGVESRRDSNSLTVCPPKTSVSDSRLTGEGHEDDIDIPEEMSHSAPHSHHLEIETDDLTQLRQSDNSGDSYSREVQRTISLTSENPSEMFFSAEEDISNVLSQGSNILNRNSTGGNSGTFSQKKRFSSDLSIGGQNDVSGMSTYRSDLEIHAPDSKALPKRPQSSTELQVELRGSSSDTPSLSSNSFISAMSSQEDVALINLHMQVNRPIIDSPLLMASYLNHLSQVKCFNWASCSFPSGADIFSTPLFTENEDGGLTYIGSKMNPHFDLYSHWREIKIVPRYESNSGSTSSTTFMCGPKSHPWDPSVLLKEEENEKSTNGFDDGEFMSLQTEAASCTSVVARLKGQVNVFLTPVMLEGLQRMVESLIPTINSLHFLTVVNYIHSSCISKVENDNILKRDQSLSYWSQVHSNSKRSTTERNLQGPMDSVLSDVYEESISTKTQGLIVLPKISITMLQSSIIEEVISIAALDNVQDLNCVSLLAFHIEGVSMKFHLGKTTKASMHNVYIQQTVRSSNNKKGRILKGTRALLAHLSSQARPDNVQGEPILIETSEKQLEELVITLDIGRAHAQFRRLKTESSNPQDSPLIVTAIPEHKSKAMFECLKMPESTGIENMGFIIFECGLEGVGVKIVKRSHFENTNKELEIEADNGNGTNLNINDICSVPATSTTTTTAVTGLDLLNSKAEAAWRMLNKKPPTPKTPKEKFTHALENIIIHDKDGKQTKAPKGEEESGDKKKGTKDEVDNVKETDKTSSCIIELKCVWFNFAAPPCVPLTRKIDFSRLDWNLLSTAAPAITAWMNPSNRLAIKIVALMRAFHTRHTAIAACLMAEALENEKIQRNPKIKKSRYSGSYTLLSKTLQEDPSCQLCSIMQKLVLNEGITKFEGIFKQGDIPHLNTLRQGVIVLSRQWKNTLYNPILFEHQYKNKLLRPVNLTYNYSQNEEDDIDFEAEPETEQDGDLLNNYVVAGENPEESENALLLGQSKTINNNQTQSSSNQLPNQSSQAQTRNHLVVNQFGFPNENPESVGPSPSLHSSRKAKLRGTGFSHGNSSRSSIQILPNVISGLVEKQNPEIEYGTLQEGSLSSTNSVHKFWMGNENQKEDLYFWMAKQQEQREKQEKSFLEKEHLISRPTQDHPKGGPFHYQSHGIIQDSITLLDAHLIFEPLLSCLGVMPQQMVNKNLNADISSLENFGTNLSLIGSFDSIRVDIVVSEAMDKKNKPKMSKKPNGRNLIIDHPSFLCERVGIELEVLKMSDGMVDHARQNVIYMSRRQLKKHTSTVINFSLNIRYISQQVNMPLLRLLHQITSMYQNVKDAQNEFHEQPDVHKKSTAKDECSLASEPNDLLQFASHESYLDEKYDKFNESIPAHSMIKPSSRVGPVIHLTPSPNAKNRPQSFAQKLRSTGKTVKGKLGYTNLNETSSSPLRESPTTSVCEPNLFKMSMDSKQSLNGCGASSVYGDFNTLCKKNSLTLNGSLPPIDTPNCWKTIFHLLELYGTMPETKTVLRTSMSTADAKRNFVDDDVGSANAPTPLPQTKEMHLVDTLSQEKTRLIVFGVAKIHKTKLLAMLSGLKLEAEITTLNSSATWRKKARPVSLECSITGQVGRTSIVLLEGVAPGQQTVVKVTVGKSQTLYSSLTKRGKDKNSGLLSIGPVNIDIPQHPVALHGVMTRSSKQLSSTLQELRVGRNSARSTKHSEEPETPYNARDQKEKVQVKKVHPTLKTMPSQNGLLQPLVMQFNILLQSLSINAALLPSLQAQYRMNHVSSTGVTGNRAKFVVDLPTHTLSFTTKIQNTEMNLPAEACISLPQVHVQAEYIPDNRQEDIIQEGIVLRQGGYLNASAEIGEFEKCLTTDLLNHLVFVQKVFMKEVNEVVQKVYGGEKPVPLWSEDSDDQESSLKRILFSLNISMKRIQLTATTPCSSAVRFETGALELHLSNRVKNVGEGNDRKLFFKSHIDFNLALGQIIKNIIFDEAEPEFQQYAFFHTTIGLRNAFQDELSNEDKELILLKLKRPLLYIQPIAVDKAILVWLNYKNAYEYWAEKRANLNLNCNNNPTAPYQFGQLASSNLSTLFLQLTVEDMGICLPLNTVSCPSTWGTRSYQEFEPKGAVVITLENTIISACNSGSLVSKGRFSGLCLRFADDFETTLDDWKPNMNDSNIMNLCVVSEGTYEVCSRTVVAKKTENAKWLLNVKWQMEGVDIHLDVNIGKQLSSLGHTLTMLTGYEDDEQTGIESPDSDDGDFSSKETNPRRKEFENVPTFVFDPTIDSKKRSLMMEKEMTEQLKIINDLRTLGASQNTIIHEEKRLQELQAICYKYFRKDMMQKFKRPSIRRAMLKSTNRSNSFMGVTYEEPALGRLDPIASNDEISSLCSTPGPSRSASLRAAGPNRVPLNESMRQTSLPNQDIDSELTENDSLDWAGYDEGSPPQINIDGTSVEMRRKSSSFPPLQKEPNIDFELDIKVLVNSGKCVLHTKEPEERLLMQSNSANKTHKRERSFGTANEWGSPTPSRRHRDRSKLRYANANSSVLVDLTIFHIPGLDVKLQYQSKTLLEDVAQRPSSHLEGGNSRKYYGSKRAALFAWMTLQSVPEETIISPHILEFLEQALEPIPTKAADPTMTPVSNVNVNLDILPANYVTYASFPVDVIVYFHMQPSTFRFSCLPVSRVECMLQLPSLDIVFSSKRPHDEESKDDSKEKDKIPNGGLSVTGCLADFNVYIFHPYGGKKSGNKEAQFSPLTDIERKDSLSINVEFVKFHITRSRKLYIEPGPKKGQELSKAVIRFSTIIDIGSASFKYDMRRLTEILAFPKAWYRKRIMRRLFLGDLSMNQSGVNSEMDMANIEAKSSGDHFMNFEFENGAPKIDKLKLIGKSTSVESSNTPSEQNQVSAWETLVLFGVNFTKLSVQMNMGNVMGNVVWLTKDFQSDGRLSIGSTGTKNMNIGIYLGGSSLDAKGGIVGGSFEVNKINTRFHIKEELGIEPCHTVGLNFMALELRLDYMGTSVLMTRISSFSAALKDEWKTNPQMMNAMIFIHGDLSWDQLQIMISKSTTADILKMYFKLEEFFTQQFKSSKRVFTNLDPQLHGRTASARRRLNSKGEKTTVDITNTDAKHHRHWQKPLEQAKGLVVPTLITRLPISGNILGGTAELHGNNISLACFHGINFKSKSWALFSLRSPCINFATEAQQLPDSTDVHVIETLTFGLGQQNAQTPQSHSMAIVSRISRNIRNYPPQFKTLNEWFHYAFANSEIDAVDRFPILERDRENAMNSIERVRGTVASGTANKTQENNHNREVIFALPGLQLHFKTDHMQGAKTPEISDDKPEVGCSFITEFEDHIFVTVDADAFFFLHDLITSYVQEKEKVIITQSARAASPNLSHNPKNQLKPLVTDDIKSNQKSGETTAPETSKNETDGAASSSPKKPALDLDLEAFAKDWRHFDCKTWHLEPTVRLLSWAGKSIEPYGIDYILNKLGFSHARTTIPKWLQRGCMDPLDKVQAIMMLQLLALVKENKNDSNVKKS